MTDKEKVIKGLEWHARIIKAGECRYSLVDCPYVEDCKANGTEKLFEDALALLSEEPVEPVHRNAGDFCGRCDSYVRWSDKYCPECGAKILRKGL